MVEGHDVLSDAVLSDHAPRVSWIDPLPFLVAGHHLVVSGTGCQVTYSGQRLHQTYSSQTRLFRDCIARGLSDFSHVCFVASFNLLGCLNRNMLHEHWVM